MVLMTFLTFWKCVNLILNLISAGMNGFLRAVGVT